MNEASHKDMANAIRALAMDAVQKANSGHPGMPMGMADVATVLYSKFLKFNPAKPEWADRDRFILSAGHGSMLLYALNYLTGYKEMTLEQIKNFRQLGAITAGHPEYEVEAGIEMTTGPLGQGISTAPGFALAERIMNARFGDDLVDHWTYVIASDGDLMEGVSHEASSLAGHMKLSKLIVLYDDNGISIDGKTELSFSEEVCKRYKSYGWDTQKINGHDANAIEAAIEKARNTNTPSLIACRTKIGFGAPTKEEIQALLTDHHLVKKKLKVRVRIWAGIILRLKFPRMSLMHGVLLERKIRMLLRNGKAVLTPQVRSKTLKNLSKEITQLMLQRQLRKPKTFLILKNQKWPHVKHRVQHWNILCPK